MSTQYVEGPFADAPSMLLGYAKNQNQIYVTTEGSGNSFLSKWNVNTHVLDLNHSGPKVIDGLGATRPSVWATDDDGQLYGVNNNNMAKYNNDFSTELASVAVPIFPESVYYTRLHKVGGTRYVYALSDSYVHGCDGSSTGLSFIGKSAFAGSINSNHNFGIAVDSLDRVWAFGVIGGFSNNGNATILMFDPSGGVNPISHIYNTSNTYTISGAVYGQPTAMFFSATDNSLVFTTVTNFLVKWDIGTQTIVGHLDISATPVDERGAQCASRFNPDSGGNIWLPGNDNKTVHVFNLQTLTLVTSFDYTVLYGAGTGFNNSGFGYISDIGMIASGRQPIFFANNFWDFSPLSVAKKPKRIIFINT